MNKWGLPYFAFRLKRFAQARLSASVLRSTKSPAPLTLHIEATNNCNLQCVMCFQRTMERKRGYIKFDMFRNIIDQAAGWIRHLQIANFGEPLLHPQIDEMVRYASGKGFFVELFTNGALLKPELSQRLVNAGLGKINISIDAMNDRLYRSIRGCDLKDVFANVRALAEVRDKRRSVTPYIVIAAADLAVNPGEAKILRQKFRGIGADGWYVTPSMNWAGAVRSNPAVKYEHGQYAGCLFPWYLVNVSHEGIVSACCIDAELGNRIGSINEKTLKEIWNDQPMQILRKRLLTRDIGALEQISNCPNCSRLYRSQNRYTANRGRVELAQLKYFLRRP